jgi:hypothetical protein
VHDKVAQRNQFVGAGDTFDVDADATNAPALRYCGGGEPLAMGDAPDVSRRPDWLARLADGYVGPVDAELRQRESRRDTAIEEFGLPLEHASRDGCRSGYSFAIEA